MKYVLVTVRSSGNAQAEIFHRLALLESEILSFKVKLSPIMLEREISSFSKG